jgi:hypothetical protein
MDVESFRGRADVSPPPQELFQRLQERRRTMAVVLGDARHCVTVGVAGRGVERHAQEVLVGAELVVGHNAGAATDDRGAEKGVTGLLEAGGEARRALTRVRDTDRDTVGGLADLADAREKPFDAGHRNSQQRAHRILASVEERAGGRRGERPLDLVVRRSRRDDEVALIEVAAQAGGASFDVAESRSACELLEEVLDQVLLRQPLDQLDLLERDCRLVRGGAREVDLGRLLGDEEPEQLVVGNEGYGDRREAAAAGKLGTELGQAHGPTSLGAFG